ncbi:MAG: hypothetical protein Fur0018_04780 [Anaerolineales bacterium]
MNPESPPSLDTLYCANHPAVETQLRCNRCEKPICPKCAVSTPTGYRCQDCVHAQQKVFQTALRRDYVVAFSLAAILSLLINIIALFLGIWALFLAFIAGFAISEVVRKATGRRRSKALFWSAAIGAAAGMLPFLLIALFAAFESLLAGSMDGVYTLLIQAAYTFLVVTSTYQRIKGIVL